MSTVPHIDPTPSLWHAEDYAYPGDDAFHITGATQRCAHRYSDGYQCVFAVTHRDDARMCPLHAAQKVARVFQPDAGVRARTRAVVCG